MFKSSYYHSNNNIYPCMSLLADSLESRPTQWLFVHIWTVPSIHVCPLASMGSRPGLRVPLVGQVCQLPNMDSRGGFPFHLWTQINRRSSMGRRPTWFRDKAYQPQKPIGRTDLPQGLDFDVAVEKEFQEIRQFSEEESPDLRQFPLEEWGWGSRNRHPAKN